MKSIFLLIEKAHRGMLLALLLCIVEIATTNAENYAFANTISSIDPALLEEMNRRSEDEKINVFVIMKSRYDRVQLNRNASYFSNRSDKRAFVVNELKQFAEASQYEIRGHLSRMKAGGLTTDPTVLWIANALSFSATKSAIEDLAKRNDIEMIGFDREEYMLFDEGSDPANNTREITQNVLQVRANEVWSSGYTGAGVVVAVIDTGVNYDHLDLADHLWDGGADFPHHGWDFVNNDNDPMDDNGHGTHCAGTICGDGSAGTQTGMAPDATLMILKCFDSAGHGNTTNPINAMQWAVEHGCDVLSMSFGTTSVLSGSIYRNTCEATLDAGVVAAIAAGNEGDWMGIILNPVPNNVDFPGGCPPPYLDPCQALNPGGLSCSVCVGAVDYDDTPAYFTSQGPVTWAKTSFGDYPYTSGSAVEFGLIRPDVCAPGVDIVSADYTSNTGYSIKSGTSMATPCVAGCMALILSKDPTITPAEMCKLLEETSMPLSETKSNLTGSGRVDVMAAISNMPSGTLKLDSFTINDSQGNNDNVLNPGETVTISLTLLNDSDSPIDNASINLSTASNYINITNGAFQLPYFNGHQTHVIDNAFSFTLDDGVLPGNVIAFTITVTVGAENVGVIPFSIPVYDYMLHYKEHTILNDDNGNGSLEPGESADLRIYVENGGNIQANSLVGTLSSDYNYLTVIETVKPFGSIASGGQAYADYHITLSNNAPQDFTIDFLLTFTDANNRQTLLEFDHARYAISATLNIEGSGSITGTGFYDRGTTCVLTATPNEGYLFENWSMGGYLSHTNMTYSFTVTGNADYVASFIAINGVYLGSGESYASRLPGGTSSTVNSSLSQQIYTANEIGQNGYIRSIAFYNAGYQQQSNYSIYLKHTSKSSFQSNNDWDLVSESDLVFSGQFDFPKGEWTVIKLDTPYEYNGTSNLLLVVDDNTGPANPVYGRAYDGLGYQALYISSESDDINPLNVAGLTGNRSSMKNQIILDIVNENTTFTISVLPNKIERGVVTGGGEYHYLDVCNITAVPNEGYIFINWTEGDEEVSSESTYSFPVENNRALVANFFPSDLIQFADSHVKSICVSNWDTDDDGELSYDEAAAVSTIGTVFRNNMLVYSFNEFRFFTGVTSLEKYAFSGCRYLSSIELPNSITTIGRYAFMFCYALEAIEIPASVTSIATNIFDLCSGLENISVDENNMYFDSRNNCNAIIQTSTNNLLYGCANTIIPNTVTKIKSNAFNGSSIALIEIPNSVTTIENSAFNQCEAMTSVTIGNSATSIGNKAFKGCTSLTSLTSLSSNPPTLDSEVFSGVDKSIPVYVPYASISAYQTDPGWDEFINYQVLTYKPCHGYGAGNDKWVFIASPLTAENLAPTAIENMIPSDGNYDLYRFNQAAANGLEWQNYKVHTQDFVLENGQGYLYANQEDINIIFKGVYNEDASKVVPLAYNGGGNLQGWNLVGNPFPVNAYADYSYYVINESGTALNPMPMSSEIAIEPCTGVMVKATAAGQSVTFTKDTKQTQNNGLLQITVVRNESKGSVSEDKAIVSFNEGDALEKFVFNSENAQLYIPQGNEDYAIAFAEQQGELPINFKATKVGSYTLAIKFEAVEMKYLHLIDNVMGADVDLLQTAEYTFTAKTTDYASRFRLVFSVNDNSSTNSENFAYYNGSKWVISNEGNATLQVVDALGRIVSTKSINGNAMMSAEGLSVGVYVMRLMNGESVKTQKIVVR